MTSFRCLLQQPPTSLLQTRELESRRVLHVTTGEAEGLWQKKVANIGHVSDMIQKDFATTSWNKKSEMTVTEKGNDRTCKNHTEGLDRRMTLQAVCSGRAI